MAIIIKSENAEEDTGVLLIQKDDCCNGGNSAETEDYLTEEEANLLYATINHSQSIESITNLQSELDSIEADLISLATDLDDKADSSNLGTAAARNVPSTGNASNTEVVLGTDSRLSDARTPTTHSHPNTQITGLGSASTRDVPSSGNATTSQVVLGSDSRLSDARIPTAHNHSASDVTSGTFVLARIPTIPNTQTSGFGTASTRNVPSSGNAANTEIVLGSDSRLSDSRSPTAHNHDASAINSGIFNPARLPDASTTSKGIIQLESPGDTTKFLSGNGTWLTPAGGGGGGASDLDGLTDVTITSPIINQQLKFDGTNWINFTPPAIPTQTSQLSNDSGFVQSTRSIATGTGLTGGGDLSANRTLSLTNTGITAGTYTKLTVDAQGRATSGATLADTDIPNLDAAKIATGTLPIARGGIGSNTRNFVDLTSTETVGGVKSFSGGTLNLTNATSNFLGFGTGSGNPTLTTRSVGTKVILNSLVSGTGVDNAIGVSGFTQWYSVHANSSGYDFVWFAGTTERMRLTGAGVLSLATPLALTSGGTSATTAAGARTNLGLGSSATLNVPASAGAQATSTEVVRGDDPRLVAGSGSVTVSATAPASPTNNQLWFDLTTDEIYFYDQPNIRWLSIEPLLIEKTLTQADLSVVEYVNFDYTNNNYLIESIECSLLVPTGTVNSTNHWWLAISGNSTSTTLASAQFFSTGSPTPVTRSGTYYCRATVAAASQLFNNTAGTSAPFQTLLIQLLRQGSPTQTTIKVSLKIFGRKIRK